MKRMSGLLSILVLACFAVSCSGKGGGGEKEKWPEKPADGAPVAFEFVKLSGAGDDLRAEFKIFNFEGKPVNKLFMKLHYLDASGKELKDFPWSAQAPELVGAKKSAKFEAGAFLPKETASVKVTLREVGFKDGSKWEAPAPKVD